MKVGRRRPRDALEPLQELGWHNVLTSQGRDEVDAREEGMRLEAQQPRRPVTQALRGGTARIALAASDR